MYCIRKDTLHLPKSNVNSKVMSDHGHSSKPFFILPGCSKVRFVCNKTLPIERKV